MGQRFCAAAATRGTANRMKKSLDPKERLMETAIDLFASKGFSGTSIRDIANAMGVSISNIYHYFGNKEGLWVAILRYSVEELPSALREVCALDIDPLERFRLLLKTHLAFSETHRRESKIFFIDEDMLSEEGNRINRALQSEIMDIYLTQLGELRERGLIRTPHIKIAAFNIFGVLNWVLRWYRPGGKMGSEAVYEEVIDFIMHGLTSPHDKQGA
jgi:AcrR family transcriptional regulator